MAMLHADSDEFRERFPHYAKLYDANGNRITGAVASDLESGEVIELVMDPETGSVQLDHEHRLIKRTVRYPAPLTLVPNDPPPDR
jgi:hypothetical protein